MNATFQQHSFLSPRPRLGRAVPGARPDDWISQVEIDHGPLELLGRFFLTGDLACRRLGITLKLGTFDDILAVNRANRDSWKPLMPIYDPRYHAFDDTNSAVILGLNSAGDVVATHALRLLRLTDMNLHDYAASLALNYSDPERMKAPDERCIPTAPAMKKITGRVQYGGAFWFHPSVRKIGLAPVTMRIMRAHGYAKWKFDYATAFIVEGPYKGGVGQKGGHANFEWGVEYANTPMGSFQTALSWMTGEKCLADIREFSASLASQVDPAVPHHRA